MGNKKYQIFVSSTYEDLKEERKTIIETISKLQHLPVGMELFVASNDEQFEYIKRTIDNCDYYVLILGGRYGSISEITGISYTEMEFDYAVSKGMPVLVFPYKDIEKLPEHKKDKDLTKIKAFIKKATDKRLAKFWDEDKNLVSDVIIALAEQFNSNPQRGWIRPDEADNSELLKELNEVRKEKEALIKQVKKLENSQNNFYKFEDIAKMDEEFTIHYTYGDLYLGNKHNAEIKMTWDEIFASIGPLCMEGCNLYGFKHSLAKHIKNKLINARDVEINEDDIDTIKIQLMALQLVEIIDKTHLIKLTPKGMDYLTKIKTVKTKKKAETLS